MKKRTLRLATALLLVAAMTVALVACGNGDSAKDDGNYTIVTVVKLTGVAWFDRMEVGVNRFAADTGMDAWQTGHHTADPAEQVRVIEDLIAQGVDAICVVPNSTPSLEAVLARAREEGIVVISHEATDIVNADANVEAFMNDAYGEQFGIKLAELMDGQGEYTTFVGSLTATSHNEWVDGSNAYIAANFPGMELVANKNESAEDATNSYNRALELFMAYPDLVGFQGSASTDVPGIARAVEELGKIDSTFVVGTSLVSVSGQYLESGAIDMIGFWDPAEAGYAMNELALHILQGGEIAQGMNLKAVGYQNLTKDGLNLYGSAWVHVTKENMGDWDF